MTARAHSWGGAAPFRIAHLSDLHLTASDDAMRSEPKLFGKLIGMNRAFRKLAASDELQKADLVIVTGDVTDRGELDAWKFFWEALEEAKLLEKTWVIPGNHDVCCLGIRMPDRRNADRDIQKLVRGLALKKGHPTRFPWAHSPDGRVAVFALNSNNLGNVSGMTNAVGWLGHWQLARLARMLARFQEIPVKIIALHHSPNIPGDDVAVERGLMPMGPLATRGHQIDRGQRAALRLVGIAQHVRLIVHGHLHRREDRRVDGIRIIGVPASTEPLRTGARSAAFCRFALYTIGGSVPRVHVRWVDVPVWTGCTLPIRLT